MDNKVKEVLEDCIIENNIVRLPMYQLDRKLYLEVAKKLELIGGKWNRKVQGFSFQEDPTDLFDDILNGENRNIKKEYQFFETPSELARQLCTYIKPETGSVLEPSAGRGAIVRAINEFNPDIAVMYCELMELNRKMFKGDALYLYDDFLTWGAEEAFDSVVANPPFSKNQDIEHFYCMVKACRKGGRVISIMSKHWQHCNNKKETQFREFLKDNNAQIIDVEAGAFKESGTSIASCIVILDKI